MNLVLSFISSWRVGRLCFFLFPATFDSLRLDV